ESKHALIIKFFASFHDESNLYIVLEHHLCDLDTRMRHYHDRDMSFPKKLLNFYMAELCTAVVGLHTIGIVHRDIKPENILIDREGHIVLCDFGLAEEQLRPPLYANTEFVSPSWVRDGNSVRPALIKAHQRLAGTPFYMSPEVLLGWPHGSSVDWWGVGAVMFTLCARHVCRSQSWAIWKTHACLSGRTRTQLPSSRRRAIRAGTRILSTG
ncbi:kinase-like domain-containing protein, partial [Schizophyllum commune]